MKKNKTIIGTMACLCCGKELPVKQAENGTLSMPCHWCEFPGYAIAGTPHHPMIMAKVKLTAAPATDTPPPAKKPVPATPPAPAPAPAAKPVRNTVFG